MFDRNFISWVGLDSTDLPYLDRLVEIRMELEESCRHFPHRSCEVTAYTAEVLLDLPTEAGFVLNFNEPHAWNIDPERKLRLDLTFDQFDPSLGSIIISNYTDPLHTHNENLTQMVRAKSHERKRRELFKRLGGDMKVDSIPKNFTAPPLILEVLRSGPIGPAEIPYSYDLWL